MRIALQPAALNDREVAKHYRDTIDTRVRFTDHARLLDPLVLARLDTVYPQGSAQFWGATPGQTGTNVSKWAKLEPGDAVFFYGQKRVYLAGYISVTFHNEALAERLWRRSREGLTWELMFALVNLRQITIPIEEIRKVLDWSDNAFIQGFTVIEGYRAGRLADLANLDALSLAIMDRQIKSKRTSLKSPSAPDGPTDGTGTASWRREHPALKRRLVELANSACGLCGNNLPANFLVGAHIKKRSFCTEEERRDFDNIGMLACVLGCDSLFERGYVAVDWGGAIIISNAVTAAEDVAKFVTERLSGRTSTWWNEDRERYYAWHRQHVFITRHDGITR